MRLGSVSKTTFRSATLSPDQLDGKTWLAIANYFDRVFLIGLSVDHRWRRGTNRNIDLYLIPHLPGALGGVFFWFVASVLALWLTYRQGVAVWVLSEPVSGLCSVPLRCFSPARIVFQVQAELLNLPSERYTPVQRFLIGKATLLASTFSHRVRAVSERVAFQLLQAGVPAGKVEVHPSRCDTELFNPALYALERRMIRASLGLGPGEMLIMFVGRLVLSKGITYILQAAEVLAKQRSDFVVAIVGGGELREELEAEASRRRLGDRVRFLGPVPYAQVPAMLAAGDVFLSPSLDEGMPRAVLEALAMELPVVVTDVGGNREILRGTDCGLLVPPRDVEAIVAALHQLLSDRGKAKQLGIKGRQMVVERFDFTTQIRALAEAFRGLVAEPLRTGV